MSLLERLFGGKSRVSTSEEIGKSSPKTLLDSIPKDTNEICSRLYLFASANAGSGNDHSVEYYEQAWSKNGPAGKHLVIYGDRVYFDPEIFYAVVDVLPRPVIDIAVARTDNYHFIDHVLSHFSTGLNLFRIAAVKRGVNRDWLKKKLAMHGLDEELLEAGKVVQTENESLSVKRSGIRPLNAPEKIRSLPEGIVKTILPMLEDVSDPVFWEPSRVAATSTQVESSLDRRDSEWLRAIESGSSCHPSPGFVFQMLSDTQESAEDWYKEFLHNLHFEPWFEDDPEPHLQRVDKTLMECLERIDPKVRRNAARCMGLSIENKKSKLWPFMPPHVESILGALKHACEDRNDAVRAAVIDAVARDWSRDSAVLLARSLLDQCHTVQYRAAVAITERLREGYVAFYSQEVFDGLIAGLCSWVAAPHAYLALKYLGWSPNSPQYMVHAAGADRNRDFFLKNWSTAKSVLVADIRSDRYARIENALMLSIGIGDEAMLPELIENLELHGTKTMAEAYLNCLQPDLESASRNWAEQHGYQIQRRHGAGPISWGAQFW